MTTPHEDRLAALLREEADTVVPAGDGLRKIQKRVAAKRRARWVLPGALVATAAAASFVFVLGDGDQQAALKQRNPGTSGEPSCPQVPNDPCPSASPTPSAGGGGLDHAFENPAIWPFTSAQQIAAWKTTYPYANDKATLVRHYLHDILGITGFTLTKPCESCDVVDIHLGGAKVGQAALERFFLDGEQVYTISVIGESDLKELTPDNGAAISSPTRVTGRITGVDENVSITLVTKDGWVLGQAGAPAGSDVPWQGTVSWTDTGWTNGDLVLKTFSAKDGTLNRLTVIPVLRDISAGPTFVGVSNGRVDRFDGTDGHFLTHLTYPPAGFEDTPATSAAGRLVWLRSATSGCQDSLAQTKDGTTSVLVRAGFRLRDPRLSPDGQTLAYWREPCAGGAGAVVEVNPSGTLVYDSAEPYGVWDVANDGRLLLSPNYGDFGTVLLPAGARTLSDSTPLSAAAGCHIGSAAFDGDHPIGWEKCQVYDNRLVTFTAAGERASIGTDTGVQFIHETSVRDGHVLVSGAGRDDSAREVFAYRDGALVSISTSASTADW